MKTIKRITERSSQERKPYVIERVLEEDPNTYTIKHYGESNTIFELEQTSKGVYITLWIARKNIKLFLSNKDIVIEYEE